MAVMVQSRLRRASCEQPASSQTRPQNAPVFGGIGSALDQRVAPRIAVSGLDQRAVHVFISISHRAPAPLRPSAIDRERSSRQQQTELLHRIFDTHCIRADLPTVLLKFAI